MQRLHGAMRGTTQRPAHGLVAIVLCYSLCFPAPLGFAQQAATDSQAIGPAKRRPEYASGQLARRRAHSACVEPLHLRPETRRPGSGADDGPGEWFDTQLHPATIDETDLNARLAQYPAMQWSIQDLLFRLPSNAIIRQAANGKVTIPPDGTLHAVYENQIYRFKMRKAAQAEKQAAATANPGSRLPTAPMAQERTRGQQAQTSGDSSTARS